MSRSPNLNMSKLPCLVLKIFLVMVATVFALLILSGIGGYLYASRLGITNIGSLVSNFVFPDQDSQNSTRLNILILGKGGAGHEAPDLTDSMIFVSIPKQGKGDIVFVSLPRDIWIAELRAKLNSVYYWGNKKESAGIDYAKKYVSLITGVPVDHALVLDFSGFKDAIDAVGGIEVNVVNSFIDERYPIAGKENDTCNGDLEFKCRYETIKFEAGKQKMDGETALKFVRSRNAQGDEGTDLARAARQEMIINSFKNKLLGKDVMLSFDTQKKLLDMTQKYVETDLTSEQLPRIARFILRSGVSLKPYVLGEELLEVPPKLSRYDYQYVFITKTGDWSEVRKWISVLLQ